MANAEQYAQWIVDNEDKKGTEEFDIVAQAYRAALSEVPKKEYGIGERAKSAFSSGLSQVPESLAGIGLGLKSAVGMDESVNRQAEAIRAEAQKPKEGPTGITFKELEDTYGTEGAIAALKKMPAYVAEQILQSAPSMAGPLAAGATGTMLGGPLAGAAAGIGSYGLQQFGNFMNRQAQEGATAETLAPGRAAAAAAITAPIGFYADKLTLGLGAIPEKILGKEVAAELAKRTGGAAARGAIGATTGVVAEAPTEVLEQIAERWQAGLPLNDEQAKAEYKEAFFGAAAVGGVAGAGSRLLAGRPEEDIGAPVPLKSVDLVPEEELAKPTSGPNQLALGAPPEQALIEGPPDMPRIGMNQRQIGYSPLPGVPRIFPNGDVALTPEQEFQARYSMQKGDQELGTNEEIEAKFSRYNQALKAAKDRLVAGQITPEQFAGVQNQYNQFRQEYDAYKERTAAPLRPDQKEAADIADKIELLGEKGFADAIRGAIKSGREFNQDGIQFYNEKLAEFQARKAEEGQRIEEVFGFSKYLEGDKDQARYEAAINSKNKDVSDTLKSADEHIQKITDAINQAGYKVGAIGASSPSALRDLKSQMSQLAGIAHRLTMENEATSKGYKRADAAKLARAISETKADIEKTKALIEKAGIETNELVQPPEITQANKDIASAEMAARKVKRESMSLWTALTGKLSASEVRDIFSKKPTFGQRSLQTQNGVDVSTLVANGTLNDFLPPDKRNNSETFDEQESTRIIKEKLAEQNYISFDAEMEIEKIFGSVREAEALIREHLSAEEANKLIQEAQSEQDRANRNAEEIVTKGATGAAESISTQDLINEAKRLDVDVEAVAQDVARQAEGMTQEQYNAELRKSLTSEINSKSGNTETLAQAKGEQKGFTATKEDLKTQAEIKGKTMIGLAEWAIKNAPNKFSKFVGEKVLARLKALEKQGVTLNFKVEDGNRRPNSLYSASGSTEFVWGADGNHTVISIALNGAPVMENQNGYPSGLGYDTILHELLHAATRGQMRFLASTDPLVKELRTLYNTVVDHFNAEVKAGRVTPFMERIYKRNNNALLNPDELISWGLTDKEMQDFLNNIKVGEKTVMDKIVQLVRELLGIPKPFETALDRLVRTTDKLLEADVKVLANGMVREGYTLGRKPGQQTLFSKKAQELFGKETFEQRVGKGQPQPTGKGQESIDILNDLGRGEKKPDPTYREKVEATWNNAKANPEATYEHFKDLGAKQVSKFKTAVFSSDAAFQDAYEEYVNQMSISDQAKLGLIMQARTSQASHADAVAGVVLEMGSAEYDQSTYKWKGVKTKDNFMALRKVLDKIQNQNGYTSEQMDMIYHTALEARQTDQMVKYNRSLANKIASLEAEMETIKEDFKSGALEPKEIARDVKRTAEIKKEIAKLKTKDKVIHLTNKQIAAGLELFKLNPGLEEAVDVWNGIRKNIMNVMVEGGQYSHEDAAFLLDNVDYVPMFREMDQDAEGGPVDSMRGLRAAADKARKGSMRPVNDIFDNQVRWVEYAVSRAVKAHQARTMMDVGVEAGLGEQFNPNVTPSSKMKNVVKIWRDGKEEHYTMSDPLFMDAFVGLQSVSIPMFKVAAKFANFLRQSIVMYPLFSVAQVSQDSVAAIFTSGLKPQFALKIPVLAVKELIQTMRNKSANHAILKEYGAVGVRDVNSTVVRLDAEAKFALNKDPSIKNKVTGWLNNFAMAADNSVRQAVYQASLDAGKTHSEALEKAFEIFNVRRRGTSKALAMAGQVIPFFPAYLAAQHVAFNVLTGKGTSPTQKKEAYKVLAQTTASVMVLSMLYAMMNGDDDDYLKKPASQRDRLLMIPGTGGMSIPLRADVFLFPKILAEHTYLLLSDKGYEDGRKFRDSMASALESALSSPTAVPQVVKPLVEVGINYNFFQQRPLIGTFQQKLMTERQFTDSTSEFGKLLGQTGLIAPINADHLIRGMFGSFGGLALWMTNDLLATANPSGQRSDMTMQDAIATMPGTSGFVAKSYESALKKDFYTLKEEVDRATNTMNELKKNSPQQIPDFIGKEENMAKLSISKAVNKIGEDLSKIRATMKQIQNSDMSGAEKGMRIKELRNAEEQMLQSIDVKKLRELGKI